MRIRTSRRFDFSKRALLTAGSAIAILISTISASAATFTAVRRTSTYEKDAYDPEDTMTIVASEDDPTVLAIVPTDIFHRHTFYRPDPWPPLVAVLFNGADSRDADCDSGQIYEKFGACEGMISVRHRENGTSEIPFARETLLLAIREPYLIKKRYDTCLSTGGAVDIYWANHGTNPQRCPPVGSIGLTHVGTFPGLPNRVAPPRNAMGLRIQVGNSYFLAEYHFLADTQSFQEQNVRELSIEERPKDEHYGELNRMMAWYEYSTQSGSSPDQETEQSTTTVSYDVDSAGSILDAMIVLVDTLSPRIEGGDTEENLHVAIIRWNIEYLKSQPDSWK